MRGSRIDVPILERPEEYCGQSTVVVAVSQIADVTPRQQSKIVGDWCRFFATGPTDFWDLEFAGRMPKRLFDSLATQTQLRRLAVAWGVYDDLSAVADMTELLELELESATSIETLEPLRSLTKLETLEVRNAGRVRDFPVVGDLVTLRQLSLSAGDGKKEPVESLVFLTRLRDLRCLSLGLIPENLDFSPLLEMTWVEEMTIWTLDKHRKRMNPSLVDLEWALPGLQRRKADVAAGRTYIWRRGERVGDYRHTEAGDVYVHLYDLDDPTHRDRR